MVFIVVILYYTIAKTSLEVLELFVGWFNTWARINLLKRKVFVDEASVEELVANSPHVLLGDFMLAHFLFSIVEVLRSQAELLGHTFEEGLSSLLFLLTRCLNSRNESH